MTKLEIIKETAEFYNSSNRAYTVTDASCEYLTYDGKNCAVGRCIKPELIKEFQIANKGNSVVYMDIGILNLNLQEKYRGHSLTFWSDLQRFHDFSSNWNETGLSQQGEAEYKKLLEKYKNQ